MSHFRKKAELRQSQTVKSHSKQWQPEEDKTLYKNSSELEWFRTLYENIPCICFTLNLAGKVLTVSQFGAVYLGYKVAELTQKSLVSVVYLEDQAKCQAKLTGLQQQPTEIRTWEVRLVHKSGSILWTKAIARLVPGTQSKPIITLAFSGDITKRLQAEAELLNQSQALANFSSNLKQLHRLNTAKYESFAQLFSEYLRTGCEIFQLPTGMVSKIEGQYYSICSVQSDFDYFVPGLELELKNTYCEAVVNEQKTISYSQVGKIESMLSHPIYQNLKLESYIGTPIFVNNQIYGTLNFSSTQARSTDFEAYEQELIELMAQSIGSFIAAHQVEMEHQQRLEALRESEARLRLALEAAHIGTWDWNIVTNNVVYSDQLGPVFGLPRGTYHPTYEAFLNSVYLEDRQFVAQAITRAIEEGVDYGIEFRANWPDGTVHWVGNKGQVYYDDSGKPMRMVGVAMDITDRKQAEESRRQQCQKEQQTQTITERIQQSLNLEEILNNTVAEVRQFLECDRVIIFRIHSDGTGVVAVESVGSECRPMLGTVIWDHHLAQSYIQLYQQGRVQAVEDIYTATLTPCHRDLLAEFQVRANLVVPIVQEEQLWGLLVAQQCSEPRKWQPMEIDLLKIVSTQAAIALGRCCKPSAIAHSQLYEKANSHFSGEQLLNQLTQAIRSSLDLETIFATAVREISSLLQVDHAHITQYLPKQKLWLNVSEYRKSNDWPVALGIKIPDENNPIADQLKRLEIVRIHDANSCEDEINKEYAQTFRGAWLLVPLHFGNSVWGSLGLVKNIHPYHWSDAQVELICAVADQIAIAIQQAELYQQSRTATAQAQLQAQQLEQALMELQQTQGHLVQSEKMSSLGQLVAGVAHEINNPVSFIYGNLVHASGYTNDILGLVQLYQQHYPNPVPEISSEIEEIDLEFLMEDLPKLLSSMKLGAERICEIVAALRNFSRIAEAEVNAIDLHEGLDSTLMILQNRLKASGKHPEIQVIKEYGNVPLVECYAGQLNQVFMNVLVNAIDAIDEQIQMRTSCGGDAVTLEEIKANPSFIRVRTELVNDHEVAIRIADNGPGMTEEVKARLFDPFFTTKSVGTGTGLGLSISYQIVVEKHGGQLHCYSQLGQGTEFVIQIPLSQGTKS